MTCSFCETDCCLRELSSYCKGNFCYSTETPTHFEIQLNYENGDELLCYNGEVLISKININGDATRFFNEIPHEKFSKHHIYPLFEDLKKACVSHAYIRKHNISLSIWIRR